MRLRIRRRRQVKINEYGVLHNPTETLRLVKQGPVPGEVVVELFEYRGRWYHAGVVSWAGSCVGSGSRLWPARVSNNGFPTRQEALDDAMAVAYGTLMRVFRRHRGSDAAIAARKVALALEDVWAYSTVTCPRCGDQFKAYWWRKRIFCKRCKSAFITKNEEVE